MATKLFMTTLLVLLLSGSGSVHAEKFQYELLKPADPPCLFLMDEDTGSPTGNAVNPPCDLGGTIVNPGDTADPVLRAKYGKPKTARK